MPNSPFHLLIGKSGRLYIFVVGCLVTVTLLTVLMLLWPLKMLSFKDCLTVSNRVSMDCLWTISGHYASVQLQLSGSKFTADHALATGQPWSLLFSIFFVNSKSFFLLFLLGKKKFVSRTICFFLQNCNEFEYRLQYFKEAIQHKDK